MDKIKIGIVEDEVIIADNLQAVLQSLGYAVAPPAASFQEAMLMIEKEKPDMLLLDIQLKGNRDGIELAMQVKNAFQLPFIFLTANADAGTVQRAKQASPHAYLVKPFNRDDLYAAIEICLHNFSAGAGKPVSAGHDYVVKDALFIKSGQSFHKVKFADIVYLQSDHVYVQVHTVKQKFLVRAALSQYLLQFDQNKFVRIHRGYVINMDYLQQVNASDLMINDILLPISKSYADDLMKRLQPAKR